MCRVGRARPFLAVCRGWAAVRTGLWLGETPPTGLPSPP